MYNNRYITVTPSWAGCWGPPHSCSVSRAIYLSAQRNWQPARPTPRLRPPSHPGKTTPGPMWHWPTIWNHCHIEDSCGFQWRDVDAVTPEFPLDLHNTSPEHFHHCVDISFVKVFFYMCTSLCIATLSQVIHKPSLNFLLVICCVVLVQNLVMIDHSQFKSFHWYVCFVKWTVLFV